MKKPAAEKPRLRQATIVEALRDPRLFGGLPPFKDLSSWASWVVALKAAFALPMDPSELAIYSQHTGRSNPPATPPRELWVIAGRRAGKSLMAAVIAVFLATLKPWPLGIQTGYIMVIACDRRQAQNVFSYIKQVLRLPALRTLVESEGKEEVILKNRIAIAVQTSSYRGARGYQVLAAILDETSFMRSELTANPAAELITALRPSLGSMPGSKLISISTGFTRTGPQWEAYRDKYGQPDPNALVWVGSTRSMNPLYDQATIEQALKEDYAAASVEYGIDGNFFRADLEGFIDAEALEAVIAPGRHELPPIRGMAYVAGIDPSGGRGDAMVLSIAHQERDLIVEDAIRSWNPPFNPQDCVKDFVKVLREYRIQSVTGDRYSGSWCSSEFEKLGIEYRAAEMTKSDYYLELLPILMRRGCQLLDHKRQTSEFRQLLRRTGRGKDQVDHPPNGGDDHANSGAISIVETARGAANGGYIALLGDVWPGDDNSGGRYSRDEVGGTAWFRDSRKIR
jgi:hypothetical protein